MRFPSSDYFEKQKTAYTLQYTWSSLCSLHQ